jgi:hypothetical protein
MGANTNWFQCLKLSCSTLLDVEFEEEVGTGESVTVARRFRQTKEGHSDRNVVVSLFCSTLTREFFYAPEWHLWRGRQLRHLQNFL